MHIKLGLMSNFVKAMEKNGAGFRYLTTIFPALSNAKLCAGVFNGPDIRKAMKNPDFDSKLNPLELRAWVAFKAVVKGF